MRCSGSVFWPDGPGEPFPGFGIRSVPISFQKLPKVLRSFQRLPEFQNCMTNERGCQAHPLSLPLLSLLVNVVNREACNGFPKLPTAEGHPSFYSDPIARKFVRGSRLPKATRASTLTLLQVLAAIMAEGFPGCWSGSVRRSRHRQDPQDDYHFFDVFNLPMTII
jgi:hypothetical protein